MCTPSFIGLPALGLGQPGRILTASAIYTPFDGSSLRSIVEQLPGVRVVETEPDYFRAEFTSRILRFVDDLEFLLDPEAQVIHVRSASRTGYWDFGANRKRVEQIRKTYLSDRK